jgi:hypothetical protein
MYDTQMSLVDTNSVKIQPNSIYLILRGFVTTNIPTITSSLENLNYCRFRLLLALKSQAGSIFAETVNLKVISNSLN